MSLAADTRSARVETGGDLDRVADAAEVGMSHAEPKASPDLELRRPVPETL